jgi:hypothetical protein
VRDLSDNETAVGLCCRGKLSELFEPFALEETIRSDDHVAWAIDHGPVCIDISGNNDTPIILSFPPSAKDG